MYLRVILFFNLLLVNTLMLGRWQMGPRIVIIKDPETGKILSETEMKRPFWELVSCGYPAAYDKKYVDRLKQLFDKKHVESIEISPNENVDDNVFFKSILGYSYYSGEFNSENASATRVSIAITISPMMKSLLDKDVAAKELKEVARVVEGILEEKKYYFITDVEELRRWLSKNDIWGDPHPISAPKNLNALRNNKIMKNKKGVCIISKSGNSNKGSYATLWTGNDIIGGHDYIGKDCTVYFWELKERDCEFERPIVVYRYMVPGLNEYGTDIADDMCYGFGDGTKGKIYQPDSITEYMRGYKDNGFDSNAYAFFSNQHIQKARYSKDDLTPLLDIYEFIDNMNEDTLFSIFKTMAKALFSPLDMTMRENIGAMVDHFRGNTGDVYDCDILTNRIKDHPSTQEFCSQIESYIIKRDGFKDGNIQKLKNDDPYLKDKNKNVATEEEREERLRKEIGLSTLTPEYPVECTLMGLKNITQGYTIAINKIWAAEVGIICYKKCGNNYYLKYRVTLYDHFGLNIEDIVIGKEAHKIIEQATDIIKNATDLGKIKNMIKRITNIETIKNIIDDITNIETIKDIINDITNIEKIAHTIKNITDEKYRADKAKELTRLYVGKPAGWIFMFRAWFILQHFKGYRPFITKISFEREKRGPICG